MPTDMPTQAPTDTAAVFVGRAVGVARAGLVASGPPACEAGEGASPNVEVDGWELVGPRVADGDVVTTVVLGLDAPVERVEDGGDEVLLVESSTGTLSTVSLVGVGVGVGVASLAAVAWGAGGFVGDDGTRMGGWYSCGSSTGHVSMMSLLHRVCAGPFEGFPLTQSVYARWHFRD